MKTVLVVDDTIDLLEMYTARLTLDGFTVLNAQNGAEGLALALKDKPDLIVLDVRMPVMDGMTAMKKLRQDPWGNHVPIILLTNILPDTDETIAAITEDQPSYYLVKQNTTPEILAEKVKEVLEV